MDTVSLPPGMTYQPFSDDTYVLTVDHVMTKGERQVLSDFLAATFEGKRTIVLEPGMTLERLPSIEVVERIEAKLDALLGHHGMQDDNDAMDNQE